MNKQKKSTYITAWNITLMCEQQINLNIYSNNNNL